ncbi:hypothetical protein Plim_3753 [Planctopirus limnophila DSM 3776]|uniref:Soluble ligand binding domain-containing protein n=1 Tax=Planctopirus limnophila (strain ATCC 43296 / DSM 3776 / IFAM 1008 / Mu 290) TaxID=521674 RepID=D5SWH2_PLAL2|nr:SLBB domain-containing protein [Planctopirus limnophila]ADG69565.1 hypothetical protein Plim_3753 [Planctopirus limnophila DSM 3776]
MWWPKVATLVLGLFWVGEMALAQSRPSSPRIINFQTTVREEMFVAVVGEVSQPGVYRLPAGADSQNRVATIEQLVAQAGGLNPTASPSLRVIRKSRPDQRVYYHPAGATSLEAGDVIIAENLPDYAPPDAARIEQNGVQLVLLGVLPRPIVVRVKTQQASVSSICAMLGQPPELSRNVKVLSPARIEHVDQTIPQTALLIFAPGSINPAQLPEFPPVREWVANAGTTTTNVAGPQRDPQITPTAMLRTPSSNQTTEEANLALLQQAEIGVGRTEPLGEPYVPGSQPREVASNPSAPWPRQAANPAYPQPRTNRSQVEDVPPPPGMDGHALTADLQRSASQNPAYPRETIPVQTTQLPGGSNPGERYSASGMSLPLLPAISAGTAGRTEAAMASQSGASPSGTSAVSSAPISLPAPEASYTGSSYAGSSYTGPTRVEIPAYSQNNALSGNSSIPVAPLPPEVADMENESAASQGLGSYLTTMALILGTVIGLMGAAFAAGRFLDPLHGQSVKENHAREEHEMAQDFSLARLQAEMPAPLVGQSILKPADSSVQEEKRLIDDEDQSYRSILKPAANRTGMARASMESESLPAERTLPEQPTLPTSETASIQQMIEDLLHNRLELHEEPAWINRQLRFQELPADRRFARFDPAEAPLSQESGQTPHFLLSQSSRTLREPSMGDRPIHRETHEELPRRSSLGANQNRSSHSSSAVYRRVDTAQDALSRDRTTPPGSAASKGATAPFEQALVQLRGTKKS